MKSSSLPAIIYMERNALERSDRLAKFSVGPMAPKPGPMLPRQVITDEKHVIRSRFSNDMTNAPAKIRTKYKNIWLAMAETVSLDIFLSFKVMFSITFG